MALSIARSIVDLRCGSLEEPLGVDEEGDLVVFNASRIVGGLPVQGCAVMTSTPNCILSFDVVVLDDYGLPFCVESKVVGTGMRVCLVS